MNPGNIHLIIYKVNDLGVEMGLEPTRAYFWPAVNKTPTQLWPGYFLTWPEAIFFHGLLVFSRFKHKLPVRIWFHLLGSLALLILIKFIVIILSGDPCFGVALWQVWSKNTSWNYSFVIVHGYPQCLAVLIWSSWTVYWWKVTWMQKWQIKSIAIWGMHQRGMEEATFKLMTMWLWKLKQYLCEW